MANTLNLHRGGIGSNPPASVGIARKKRSHKATGAVLEWAELAELVQVLALE